MKRWTLIAIAALAIASGVFAADLPPGKWWRIPMLVQTLGLSEDQQTRLDAIFRSHAADLIDLRGNVEKANITLRGELEQPQLNRTAIQHAAAKVSEARSRLFERELMMLVDMRAVLTDAQWTRMRNELEARGQRQQMRQQQGKRP
jgi:Spy/CpxP family protein refolding chaperone